MHQYRAPAVSIVVRKVCDFFYKKITAPWMINICNNWAGLRKGRSEQNHMKRDICSLIPLSSRRFSAPLVRCMPRAHPMCAWRLLVPSGSGAQYNPSDPTAMLCPGWSSTGPIQSVSVRGGSRGRWNFRFSSEKVHFIFKNARVVNIPVLGTWFQQKQDRS